MSQIKQLLLCSILCPSVILGISLCWPAVATADDSDIEDETCLDCHDDQETKFASGPHRLVSLGGDQIGGVKCASCHSGAEVHIDDPSAENITNPAGLTDLAARRVCLECHQPHLGLDNYGFDSHNEQQINCAACHRVHAGEDKLLLSDDADFCTRCHTGVEAAFTRRSQHPLKQGNITCLNCHQFGVRADHNVRLDQLRVCQNCHPEHEGPYPYEHPAADAYMVAGGGCLECHEPHGSENDRLLKQADEGLCLQCHMTPPGHLNLPALHGPVRDIDNCVACHSDIHGSFVSPLFLDPMLAARLGSPQPCADCHDLTR
jgi:DmsE family decaheme c-type cytochrome